LPQAVREVLVDMEGADAFKQDLNTLPDDIVMDLCRSVAQLISNGYNSYNGG